jgi:Tfp pilus assembly protein PilO
MADAETTKTDELGGNAAQAAEAPKVKEESKEPIVVGDFTKYFMLPLAMLVLSLILVFFVILPLVSALTGTLGDISKMRNEYNTLLEARNKREQLASSSNQQEADLAKINKLIPQSQTEVVDFSESIRKKAEQNSLNLQSSVVREAVITNPNSITATPEGEKGLDLAELPADFTIGGKFDNIREFLGDIFGGDDFIIIKQMELRKQTPEQDANSQKFNTSGVDNWFMSITLVKYQFRLRSATTQADLQAAYFTVPESVKANQDVLDFINENY